MDKAYKEAIALVVDANHLKWEPPGTDKGKVLHREIGLEKGMAIFHFMRTCVNQSHQQYNVATHATVKYGRIVIHVSEWLEDLQGEVVYTVDKNLDVIDVQFSHSLVNLHKTLTATGRLDHPVCFNREEAKKRVVALKGNWKKALY